MLGLKLVDFNDQLMIESAHVQLFGDFTMIKAHLFASLLLSVFLLSSAYAQNSKYRKWDHSSKKDAYGYDAGEVDGGSRFAQWVSGIGGFGGGAALTINQLKKYLVDSSISVKIYDDLKKGIVTFDLNSSRLEPIWKSYLIKEINALDEASMNMRLVQDKIKLAGGAVKDASVSPTQVNLVKSTSSPQQSVHKVNVDLLEQLSTEYKQANTAWQTASTNLEQAKLSFFQPGSNKYNSDGAKAARLLYAQDAREARLLRISRGAAVALGVYMIVGSATRIVILLDDRDPGVLPIWMGTVKRD
jgi:hypothetical protein